MSLQWTLVAGFLYIEMAIILLFILPFIPARSWNSFFKSRFLQVLARQASFYFACVLFILGLLFLDAIREMRKYNEKSHEHNEHQHLETELQISMRLFRAQRNFYIAGFALFLCLVIKRLADLISKQAQLMAENEAALKQASSASKTARTLLNQGSGEAAQNTSNEAHLKEVKELKKEIEEYKKKLTVVEKDKEAVVSQAKSLEKEYDRLSEEHRKLQLKTNTVGDKKAD